MGLGVSLSVERLVNCPIFFRYFMPSNLDLVSQLQQKNTEMTALLNVLQQQLSTTTPPVPPVPPTIPPATKFKLTPIEQATYKSEPFIVKNGVLKLDKSYKFDRDAIYVLGSDVTIDLNGHTLWFGLNNTDKCYGVRAVVSWLNEDKDRVNTDGMSGYVNNLKIINGTIAHGGIGRFSACVSSYQAPSLTVDNVYCVVNGTDSYTIRNQWDNILVSNCYLVCNTTDTIDRHMIPSNVYGNDGSQFIKNILLGGNSGIYTSNRAIIKQNLIANFMHSTNGYGIINGSSDVVIDQNIIIPSVSGRGIFSGGDGLGQTNNIRISNNVVAAWNIPNKEYGWELNACGLRLRGVITNHLINNNVFLAMSGGTKAHASGGYFTVKYSDITKRNILQNNRFISLLAGPTVQSKKDGSTVKTYAKGLTFEGHGLDPNIWCSEYFLNNSVYSNHILVSTTGFDGGCQQGEPLWETTLGLLRGETAFYSFRTALEDLFNNLGFSKEAVANNILKTFIQNTQDIRDTQIQPEASTFYSGDWGNSEVITLGETSVDTERAFGFEIKDIGGHLGHPSNRSFKIAKQQVVAIKLPDDSSYKNGKVNVKTPQGDAYDLITDPVVLYALERAAVANAPFNKVNRTSTTININGFKSINLTSTVTTIKLEKV